MFPIRRTVVKLCREKDLIKCRTISKTSTDKNSDLIARVQDKTEKNGSTVESSKWWKTQMEHNNLRALSTIQQAMIRPTSSAGILLTKDQSRDFMALFPDLVRDLTEVGRNQEIPDVMKRFARVLQYSTPNGKKLRGLMLISSYKMLEDPSRLTPENVRLANILGWCVEMLQAFFLICDDIMDNSQTRRGAPCWFQQPGIGIAALNDALMVENGIYVILKKHFRNHPTYLQIIELIHDTTIKTTYGQSLDMMCLDDDGKPKLDMFTMKRYDAVVKYKTAYYSCHLPIALGMYLAGMTDEEQHRQAKTILLEMGQFFQIQDDFLDCYGDSAVTGKIGTDIQDGKCSWLAVMALQRASPTQRKIMEEHYGRDKPESIAAVRKLYDDLNLANTYALYEEETYNLIKTHIQQISKGLKHDVFFQMLDTFYNRQN